MQSRRARQIGESFSRLTSREQGTMFMITSQTPTFLSEIVSGAPIPPEKLGYFRGRLSNRFHELVLDLFNELEQTGKITRAALARRIGKAPEQVTRLQST